MRRFQGSIKGLLFKNIPVIPFWIIALFIFLTLPLLSTNRLLAQGRPPANVVVSSVVRAEIQGELVLIGTVEAWRSSRVAAEVSGRVEALLARRGTEVKKGDLLVELGASALRLKLKAFRARRNAALARLEKANDTLKRSRGLKKEGLLSDKAFREAKLSVQELKEDLEVNEAERLEMEDALEKKKVRAPFSGTVTQELTEVGEWVSQGGAVVSLVDLVKARILLQVPEKYLPQLVMGSEVRVQFDALSGKRFTGKIHALIPEGDPASHLFPLEIHIENEAGLIKSGMLVRVHLNLGPIRSVLTVPKDALTRKGPSTMLFVIQEDKVTQKVVKTGQAKDGMIEIAGDVKAGDQVVIRGNERLREGRAVRIVPADGGGAPRKPDAVQKPKKQP